MGKLFKALFSVKALKFLMTCAAGYFAVKDGKMNIPLTIKTVKDELEDLEESKTNKKQKEDLCQGNQ